MITTAFVNLAYYVLQFIIDIFPAGQPFPSSVHTAASTLGGYLQMVNSFLPVDTLGTVVGLYLVFEIIVFGFKTFKWLLSHIPFVGGRG